MNVKRTGIAALGVVVVFSAGVAVRNLMQNLAAATEAEMRESVISEYRNNPISSSMSFVIALDDAVSSGTLTAVQYRTMTSQYFRISAQNGGDIGALYDSSGDGAKRWLQYAAWQVRESRARRSEAIAVRHRREADLIKPTPVPTQTPELR